jgi:hypothetical protein
MYEYPCDERLKAKSEGSKFTEIIVIVVYYESMNRLKTKTEESTCLTYTGLLGELEHLKIETSLIDEMFVSVMGEMCS